MTGTTHAAGPAYRRVEISAEQQALFQLQMSCPDRPVPTVTRAWRIYGQLDVPALRAAWLCVVERHQSLRTTFTDDDCRPAGHLGAPLTPTFQLADREDRSGTVLPAILAELCSGLAATGMDPRTGPPVRLCLTRLDSATHLLILMVHRLVADERSVPIVLEELSAHYAAIRLGRVPVLPAAPRWYPVAARGLSGFAEPDGPRSGLDLPSDGPRPAAQPGPGASIGFHWDEGLAGRLAALSAAEGTTPGAVVTAAMQTVVHRYSGAADAAIGITGDHLAGLCVVPGGFAAGVSFRTVVQHVDAALTAGSERSTVPPVEVQVDLAVAAEPPLRIAGTVVWPQVVDADPIEADLALIVQRVTPVVEGRLRYRSGMFEPASAGRILEHLRTLLGAALDDPDGAVRDLPLQRPAPTFAGPIPGARAPLVLTVVEQVREQARRTPSAVAVRSGADMVDYAHLTVRMAAIGGALRRAGIGPGAAVVVRMQPGAAQAAAVLGVLAARTHVICFGTGDPGDRGRAALSELRPAAMILNGPAGGDDLARWFRAELNGVLVDAAAVAPSAGPSPAPLPSDRAYVAYTSGSTGTPKGIPMSHSALAQLAGWMAREFRVGPGARIAQWAAPGYDAGLCEMSLALTTGATLLPVPERFRGHPGKVLDWLERERVTLFQTVPSFARALLKEITGRGAGQRLARLEHLLLAGEQLPGQLADGLRAALPGTRLINLYGPTESILATHHEISTPVRGRTPIGRPIPGRQVLVLDEQDRPCPPGVVGQLVVRSRYVTAGYVGAAAAERDAFRAPATTVNSPADSWYRTGDTGRLRFDGLLECLGRRDEQIKFHGIRLEITDIESVLSAQDSVAQCAVVPVTDYDGLVIRLIAYVVPRSPEPGAAAAEQWRGHLRRRFGAAMPPVSFRTLTGLPRNAGGKVDRRRLHALRG